MGRAAMIPVKIRAAQPHDAQGIALLHADSWQRHYRGAYADSFLDGDVAADRHAVWSARLSAPAHAVTAVAEDQSGLAGFVHVILDHDTRWGSLVDNLHVVHDRRGGGIGTALLRHGARAVTRGAAGPALYLWVLEQNEAAQRFYRSRGGAAVERAPVDPPGGLPERLHGSPSKLRIAWPDAAALAPAEPR